MHVVWRTCHPAEGMHPVSPAAARWLASVLVLFGLVACSTTVIEVEPATDEADGADAEVVLGNPGTLVPPTVPGDRAPELLAIDPLIAFMDACVGDAGFVGPCHCAADRMEGSLTALDLEVLEDRMTGELEFSPELAGALVGCRDAAAPPAWSDAQRQTYLDACADGSDRMRSLCACSLARAEEVVPARRLADFLASSEVRPDVVDFINLCL